MFKIEGIFCVISINGFLINQSHNKTIRYSLLENVSPIKFGRALWDCVHLSFIPGNWVFDRSCFY